MWKINRMGSDKNDRALNIFMHYTVSLISVNKKNNRRIFCFVDAKKAFDTVQRDCLWYKLMSVGIKGKILKALQSFYTNVQCAVKINDYFTPLIAVSQGVKQGCKLSPTLFSLYINDLASDIKQMNLGVDIDELQLSILLYADDIALIDPDADSLQLMLDKLHDWCSRWRLTINSDKTKIVHFRPLNVQTCNKQFSCGNLDIEVTDKYKYLGLWFQEHLDMKYATTELSKSASRALSVLYTKFKNAGGMSYEVYCKLYSSLVEPVLFYCSSIWGLTDYGRINTVQNKACRYFLGVGKNAANLATRGDMGWSDCFVKQKIECCRLYGKLINTSDDRIVKSIFKWSKSHGKCWEKRFIRFAQENDLLHLFQHNSCNIDIMIKTCKSKLIEKDKEKWKLQLFNDDGHANGNKLRTYRLYKSDIQTETYVKIPLQRDHRHILSMFRCGNLPLHIETGRFAKPKTPIDQRTCFHCPNSVENEIHFLIECPYYDDVRRKMLHKAQLCNSDFELKSPTDKLTFLMNHINMQPVVACTLFDMFQRRKRVI